MIVSRSQLLWIAVLMAIAWFAPNTRQIMARAEAFIADHPIAPAAAPLAWGINRRWAIASAVLLAASVSSMTRVSEFLYFQF